MSNLPILFIFYQTSVRIRILVVQILKYCVQGSFDYAKVLKLASENSDGVSDIKVRGGGCEWSFFVYE